MMRFLPSNARRRVVLHAMPVAALGTLGIAQIQALVWRGLPRPEEMRVLDGRNALLTLLSGENPVTGSGRVPGDLSAVPWGVLQAALAQIGVPSSGIYIAALVAMSIVTCLSLYLLFFWVTRRRWFAVALAAVCSSSFVFITQQPYVSKWASSVLFAVGVPLAVELMRRPRTLWLWTAFVGLSLLTIGSVANLTQWVAGWTFVVVAASYALFVLRRRLTRVGFVAAGVLGVGLAVHGVAGAFVYGSSVWGQYGDLAASSGRFVAAAPHVLRLLQGRGYWAEELGTEFGGGVIPYFPGVEEFGNPLVVGVRLALVGLLVACVVLLWKQPAPISRLGRAALLLAGWAFVFFTLSLLGGGFPGYEFLLDALSPLRAWREPWTKFAPLFMICFAGALGAGVLALRTRSRQWGTSTARVAVGAIVVAIVVWPSISLGRSPDASESPDLSSHELRVTATMLREASGQGAVCLDVAPDLGWRGGYVLGLVRILAGGPVYGRWPDDESASGPTRFTLSCPRKSESGRLRPCSIFRPSVRVLPLSLRAPWHFRPVGWEQMVFRDGKVWRVAQTDPDRSWTRRDYDRCPLRRDAWVPYEVVALTGQMPPAR